MDERLQKLLSQWGVASRRQAEAMILAGRVRVNGRLAQLGQRANPQQDKILVDGRPLGPSQRPQAICLLLNKPAGVVCTCHDPSGRTTVLDLLPRQLQRSQGLHPVGRLDAHSTGAILLTNDGGLTFQLTHPRHHVPKVYDVEIQGHPSPSILERWRQGIVLEGRKTQPAQVTLLRRGQHNSSLKIVLHEGRNRQIRKVADVLGHPVMSLHRWSIGAIELGDLPCGHHRALSAEERDQLGDR
ncbi:MAG: rRNA pseudouridine synthase [Synechococcales cyanobacterium RU_4_20]|nr:rRNA pseudouridine synthase [Synechococcales cyanobacterium RU_4_20]NJR69230.1 rRNA pseudouridine synthase [Synechococcales cyanobacterium CRU_2_2]